MASMNHSWNSGLHHDLITIIYFFFLLESEEFGRRCNCHVFECSGKSSHRMWNKISVLKELLGFREMERKYKDVWGHKLSLIGPFCKTKNGDEAKNSLAIPWALRIPFFKITTFIQPVAQLTCMCSLLSTGTPGSLGALKTINWRVFATSLCWDNSCFLSKPVHLISHTKTQQDWE